MVPNRHETTDIGEIFTLVARDLGAKILAEVMPQVRREITSFAAENTELCWTEDAAAKLIGDMSAQKLAQLAKDGKIGFSYAIEPSQWSTDGKPQNGRRVYMRHHIINYLLHREVRPSTATAFDVTAADAYQLSVVSSQLSDRRLKAA